MEQSNYFINSIDTQRGTPVGASDDEAVSRSATSSPHSIVQMSDEPANIYDNASVKRAENLQGKFCICLLLKLSLLLCDCEIKLNFIC